MSRDDITRPVIEKGVYRHSKTGNLYEVIGVALHTETGEFQVIYISRSQSEYEFFARPYDMFTGLIQLDGKKVPRFVKLDAPQSYLV